MGALAQCETGWCGNGARMRYSVWPTHEDSRGEYYNGGLRCVFVDSPSMDRSLLAHFTSQSKLMQEQPKSSEGLRLANAQS